MIAPALLVAAAAAQTRPDEGAAVVLSLVIVLALGAGGVAVVSRPARGAAALGVLAVALALVMLLYAASATALVGLAALGGATLVARVAWADEGVEAGAEAAPAAGRRWPRRATVLGLLAAFGFVLVGTWARQFVWTGRPPTPGAEPGAMPAVAGALGGSPGLLAVGLVALVVAAACAGPPRHRI